MTDAKLHILQHSLGADEFGRGRQYRNHFVTGEGSIDHPHCMALVEMGLMSKHAGSALTGGDDLFRVTDMGKRYMAKHSPAPPKRTRSQTRYEQYLEADSNDTFGQWLKRGAYKPGPYVTHDGDVLADDIVPF